MIDATMTSLACVPAGRLMLSDAAPLAVAAPWNPMMIAPGQVSGTSHSFAAARHTAPALPGRCWQLVLVPLQVSVVQGSPSSGHAAPAFPAGWVHVALVPLQMSVVQGLPSSGQAVPAGLNGFDGQVELEPVQVAARSQLPVAARHTVPAFPAGCVQAGELVEPLHTSVVQTLPSSVQAVPAGLTAVGQVVLDPVQVSVRSHSLTAVWQTAPAFPAGCMQVLFVPSH